MSADLSSICAAYLAAVAAVPGITDAPWPPPEKVPSNGVYAYLRPASGSDAEVAAGRKREDITLTLSIVTPRVNLPTDMARIIDLRSPVTAAVINAGDLGGLILATPEIPWTFGTLDWGGQDTIGWHLTLNLVLTGAL